MEGQEGSKNASVSPLRAAAVEFTPWSAQTSTPNSQRQNVQASLGDEKRDENIPYSLSSPSPAVVNGSFFPAHPSMTRAVTMPRDNASSRFQHLNPYTQLYQVHPQQHHHPGLMNASTMLPPGQAPPISAQHYHFHHQQQTHPGNIPQQYPPNGLSHNNIMAQTLAHTQTQLNIATDQFWIQQEELNNQKHNRIMAEDELESLKTKHQKDMQVLQQKHEEDLRSRDETNESLREENTTLKFKIEELQNFTKDLKEQIQALKDNLQAAVEGGLSNGNAQTEVQTEHENARDAEQRIVAQVQWDREQAEAKLSTQESALSLLRLSNAELKSQNAKLLESQNTHAQERNELQTIVCDLEKSADNFKSRINDLLEDQKGSTKEINELQTKLKQAESKITTLDTELTRVRRSNNDIQARNTELLAAQKTSTQEIANLKNDNRVISELKQSIFKKTAV